MNNTTITKQAKNNANYRRIFNLFPNGRSAFKEILKSLYWPKGRLILLPAYIGWSSQEGSGVFDPITELGIPFAFYRMTQNLTIDEQHLSELLKQHHDAVLLLIHYFGRVDPAYQSIIQLASDTNTEIIEDEAHALLTDLVGGISGRAGKSAFFSIHKLLPLQYGGIRVFNDGPLDMPLTAIPELQHYDFHRISKARIANFETLLKLLGPLKGAIEIIWPQLSAGHIPQSFPIRLTGAINNRLLRDNIYTRMNANGYGVVSLYHTLVENIDPKEFPQSLKLANSILNLPVHQDINPNSLVAMVDCLIALLKELEPKA